MGTVLNFEHRKSQKDRRVHRSRSRRKLESEIIIFPGVRYERHAGSGSNANSKKRGKASSQQVTSTEA